MRPPRPLALAFALFGALAHPRARAQDPELAHELERAVDLPTPIARRQAAAALAQRYASRVDDLIAAAKAFGRFEPLPKGSSSERVPLQVGAEVETTELTLYVPASYDPSRPAPALLAFHGTGGQGTELPRMWREAADAAGMLVLAPTEAGANDGYRFSERERQAAQAALRWLRRRANVDENAVFATGISRGGHLAWDLALRCPDLFAGIAPMIGSPRITIQDGQNNLRYVENVARLPIRDLQGQQDDPALVWTVEIAFEKLKKLGATDAQLFLQPEHGHSFAMEVVDWKAFFASARRDPRPARVVRASAREKEGRAFWVEVEAYAPSVEEEFTPKVSQLAWAKLDEDGKRRYLVDQAEDRTSRIEVQRTAPGRFAARAKGVKRFRLLLRAEDFDPRKDVELAWNGDRLAKRLRPSANVLLEEFVERFDRSFLPVAELAVR